ncbi:MAG TPA: hypothetical protein VFT06_07255 [Flavisolibacter sp.]|jgi:hypothetical protein|nr:hypothetical protein [Flavisolibacter sp.]
MKHYIFAAAVFVNVAYQKCNGTAVDTIPSCIQARIAEIKKQPRWNPPAQVEEYRFEGKRVFLFSSNCCDQYNELVDEACNYVCAPSGGFTGKGDRKCPTFKDSAQLIRLVWKDERK